MTFISIHLYQNTSNTVFGSKYTIYVIILSAKRIYYVGAKLSGMKQGSETLLILNKLKN